MNRHADRERLSRRELLLRGAAVTAALLPAGALAAAPALPAEEPDDTFITEVRLSVDREKVDLKKLRDPDLKTLAAVLRKRLPILVPKGGDVEVRSLEEIRVRVPTEALKQAQLRMFSRPGQLELRYLDDVQSPQNARGRYALNLLTVQNELRFRFWDTEKQVALPAEQFLSKAPLVADSGDIVPDSARVVVSGAMMTIRLQFSKAGTDRLERYTKKPGRFIAITLDGKVIGVPVVSGKVETGVADIPGGYSSEEEASYLAAVFNAGALPYPLKVLSARLAGPEAPDAPDLPASPGKQ